MASVLVLNKEIDLLRLVSELAEHRQVILNYCHAEQAAELLERVRKYFRDEDNPVIHVAPALMVNNEPWFTDQFWLDFGRKRSELAERAMNAWVLAGQPDIYRHQE